MDRRFNLTIRKHFFLAVILVIGGTFTPTFLSAQSQNTLSNTSQNTDSGIATNLLNFTSGLSLKKIISPIKNSFNFAVDKTANLIAPFFTSVSKKDSSSDIATSESAKVNQYNQSVQDKVSRKDFSNSTSSSLSVTKNYFLKIGTGLGEVSSASSNNISVASDVSELSKKPASRSYFDALLKDSPDISKTAGEATSGSSASDAYSENATLFPLIKNILSRVTQLESSPRVLQQVTNTYTGSSITSSGGSFAGFSSPSVSSGSGISIEAFNALSSSVSRAIDDFKKNTVDASIETAVNNSITNITNNIESGIVFSTSTTRAVLSAGENLSYDSANGIFSLATSTIQAMTANSVASSTIRGMFSLTATGLTYDDSTGITSLTSGYNIPLAASTTEWANKVSSQWTTSGSNITFSTGNVGIGTASPDGMLSIYSLTRSDQIQLGYDINNMYRIGRNTTDGALEFEGNASAQSAFRFIKRTGGSTSTVMTLTNSGSLGLGTTTPSTALSVVGAGSFTGNITSNGNITASTFYGDGSNLTGIATGSSFSTSTTRGVFSSTATGLTYDNSTGITSLTSGYNIPLTASTTEWTNKVGSQWTTNSNGTDISYTTGKIGIGTSSPSADLAIKMSSATSRGFIMQTASGQTSNIFEILDSSYVQRMYITPSYAMLLNVANGTFSTTSPALTVKQTAMFDSGAAGTIAVAIKGRTSQTADLQQFLDVNNSILSVVTANGSLGIGTSTPSRPFVVSTNNANTATSQFDINQSGSGDSWMNFSRGTGRSYAIGQESTGKFVIATQSSGPAGLATNPLLTIDSVGNLGIGTSSPASKLSVSGTAGALTPIFTVASSTHTPYFTVTSGGSVGINKANPTSGLDVVGAVSQGAVITIKDQSLTYGRGGTIAGYSYPDAGILMGAEGSNYAFGIIGGDVYLGGSNNLTVTSALTVKNQGNVGVGTTSPSAKLAITGTAGTSDIFAVASSTNARLFTVTSAGNVGVGTASPSQLLQVGTTMYVDNANTRVGIGLSSPTSALHVVTSGSKKSLISNYNGITSGAPTTVATSYYMGLGYGEYGANSYRLIGFGYNAGSTHFPAYIGFQEMATAGNTYGDLVFGTRPNGLTDLQPTEQMRITGAGNIGIGTSTPSAKLHMNLTSASNVGQIIRGATSQTADLTQWQTSAGTIQGLFAGGLQTDNTLGVFTIYDRGVAKSSDGALLSIHADDGSPYLAKLYNDTKSTTAPVFTYYADNSGNFIQDVPTGSHTINASTAGGILLAKKVYAGYGGNFIIGASSGTGLGLDNVFTTNSVKSVVAHSESTAATAPTTIATSWYQGIGGGEYTANSYRLTGYGFKAAGQTVYPSYIGYQEISASGNTYGDLIFGTRSVTTDTAPTERMRIDYTGNVGIGTTTPSSALTVFGTTTTNAININTIGTGLPYGDIFTVNNTRFIKTSTDSSTGVTFVGYASGKATLTGNYNTGVGYQAMNGGGGNNNTIMGFQSFYRSGDSSSASSNTVIGASALSGNFTGASVVPSQNTIMGYNAGSALASGANNILFGAGVATNLTSGSNNIAIGTSINMASTTGSYQLNIGNIIYGTSIDGTGSKPSAGNIGIGTSTPSARFSIMGTSSAPTTDLLSVASSTDTRLFTVSTAGVATFGTAGTIGGKIVVGQAGSINGNITIGGTVNQVVSGTQNSLGVTWQILTDNSGSGGPAELRMGSTGKIGFGSTAGNIGTIDTNISRISAGVMGIGTGSQGSVAGTLLAGSIGIGTSTPGDTLTIVGTSNVYSSTTNTGPSAEYGGSGGRKYSMLSCYNCGSAGLGGFEIYDITGGATRAYIQAGVNGWQTPSDIRLKEDIQTLSVLDKLDLVRGTIYNLKDSHVPQIGVIAQEIKLAFPEAVSGEEVDGKFLGVSYNAIASIALQGVKELNTIVKGLSSKIQSITAWFGADGDRFNIKGMVCVDDVCVTKDQFKQMLMNSGSVMIVPSVSEPQPQSNTDNTGANDTNGDTGGNVTTGESTTASESGEGGGDSVAEGTSSVVNSSEVDTQGDTQDSVQNETPTEVSTEAPTEI